jgi:hypothetical protein
MEEEKRIEMSDNAAASKDDLAQKLTQQVQQASDGDGGDAIPIPSSTTSSEEPTIQQKVQEAMTQGQESGLLSSEALQDGSLQEKVKDAIEKGGAPPGFMNRASPPLPLHPTSVPQAAQALSFMLTKQNTC